MKTLKSTQAIRIEDTEIIKRLYSEQADLIVAVMAITSSIYVTLLMAII
ncbi:hypothetical protein HME9304_00493 [Flagellimonas maritima]|uniref:Uncharacterized protein n=1 Tax=Flagellimonas maritima TaxID=1383885 RepID=A0A2Z4LPL3_9FLAO|nr:hypothetical protein HME9304_00493 [Allomuricauda aurantiaca]